MNLINKILQAQKSMEEKESAMVRCKEEIQSLSPWISLDVPMNYPGTKKTGFFIGSISGTYTQEALTAKIEQLEEMPDSVYAQVITTDKFQTYVTVVFLRTQQDQGEGVKKFQF